MPMGGVIFIFGAKIGLKSANNVVFCILSTPTGGAEALHPLWLRYCHQDRPLQNIVLKLIYGLAYTIRRQTRIV